MFGAQKEVMATPAAPASDASEENIAMLRRSVDPTRLRKVTSCCWLRVK